LKNKIQALIAAYTKLEGITRFVSELEPENGKALKQAATVYALVVGDLQALLASEEQPEKEQPEKEQPEKEQRPTVQFAEISLEDLFR
jgi:hypothetical protein